MWVGVVGIMAKVIEFYIPDRLRERRLWNPPEQPGKVNEFPPIEIARVTSELRNDFAKLKIVGGEGDTTPTGGILSGTPGRFHHGLW
jgi:hypothetical protein